MSASINKNVNVERRTWDKETYEARAKSRAVAEASADGGGASAPILGASTTNETTTNDAAAALKDELDPTEEKEEFQEAQKGRAGPMGSKRAFLKSRSNKVDLESKLGSTEIIDPAAAAAVKSKLGDDKLGGEALTPSSGVTKCSDGVGWHCRVCDCFLKDSLTYLDHINGRKHQRHLGYSMRVEKSTTEEVSGVLSSLAEKKREREGNGLNGADAAKSEAVDFEDMIRKKDEEAVQRKAERARRRAERKRREKGLAADDDESIQMKAVEETSNVEEKEAAESENPAEGDGEEEEEVEEGGIDPNLAAMMGFSGFGGSKK